MKHKLKCVMIIGVLFSVMGPLRAQSLTSWFPFDNVYGEYEVPMQLIHMTELPGEDVVSTRRLFVRYGKYHLHAVSGKTPEGMPREVNFVANGNKIWFKFGKGENGVKSLNQYFADLTLTMLDMEGKPTLRNAAIYELKREDGFRYHFVANVNDDRFGDFLQLIFPDGKVFTKESLHVEIIRDENGDIREVHSPSSSIYVEKLQGGDFRLTGYDADALSLAETGERHPRADAVPTKISEYRKQSRTRVSIYEFRKGVAEPIKDSQFIFDEKKFRWTWYKPMKDK